MLRKSKKGRHFKSSHLKGKITASVLAAVIAVSSAVPLMGTAIAASDDDESVGVELETEELGAEAGGEEVAAEADEEVAADSDDEEVGAEDEDDSVGAGSYDSGSGTEISFSNGPSNYSAGVNPNNSDNGTAANAQGIFWAKATYFDYLTDTEMNDGWLKPIKAGTGHNGSHDEWFPFFRFNRDIVAPMKNGWSKPLYFGNFCDVSGAYDTSSHHDTGLITGYLSNRNSYVTATNSTYAPNYNYQANNSNAVADYNTSVQGLMRATLDDTGRLITPDGQVAPYFDAEKLTQSGYARVVNSSFPFRITEKGSGQAVYDFYEFDSKNARDNVYFTWKNEGGNPVPEYVNYGSGTTYGVKDGLQYFMYQTASGYGIFPFNNASNNHKGNKPNSNEELDYGFGVRIDVKFRVPEGGKWGNEDVMFNFSGDDDLWVYITDDTTKKSHLVLDMGGAHKESDGRINFAEKKAIVDKVQSGNSKVKDEKNLDTIFGDSNGFKYDHTYTMSVFYMERGLLESNCRMSFSMIPGGNDFKVTEKINDANVNPGIKNDVKKLDMFKFKPMTYDDSSGSGAQDISGSEYTYNSASGTTTEKADDGTFTLRNGEDADFLKQIDTGRFVGISQTKVGSSPLRYTTKWWYWDNVNDPNHSNSLASGSNNDTSNVQLQNGTKYEYAELQVDFENTPVVTPVTISKTLANGVTSNDEFQAAVEISLDGGSTFLTRPLAYTASDKNGTYYLDSSGSLSTECLLKQNRTLSFSNIPVGSILRVTEKAKTGFKYNKVTGGAGVNQGGGAQFTIDTSRSTSATIENKRDELQGAVIQAVKRLYYTYSEEATPTSASDYEFSDEIKLNNNAFKFGLYEYPNDNFSGEGELIQTKFCDSSGDITFDEINYTDIGYYYYTIKEIVPDEPDVDVAVYSNDVYYVRVNVVASGHTYVEYFWDNGLEDPFEDGSIPRFYNGIKTGSVKINKEDQLGKELEGVAFEVYRVNGEDDEASTKIASNRVDKQYTGPDGVASFKELPIYKQDYKYGQSNIATVTFVNSKNWSHVYVYAADSNDTQLIGDWPGTEMTSIGNNQYQIEVPADAEYICFNDDFRNSSVDTKPINEATYTPSEKNVDGNWKLNISSAGGQVAGDKIQFVNSKNWDNVYVYAYDSNDNPVLGDWPGTAMTHVSGKTYEITIPDNAVKYCFNNENDSTIDTDNEPGKIYTPTQKTNTGNYNLTISDIMPESSGVIEHTDEDYQWYALVEVDPKKDPTTNQNVNHNQKVWYFKFPINSQFSYTYDYVNGPVRVPDASGGGMLAVKVVGLAVIAISGGLFATYYCVRRRKLSRKLVRNRTK